MKCLVDEGKRAERDVMAAIARDPMEKLHLSLLKWTLGVRKRTTNIPIWGDCGRFPIGISMIKLIGCALFSEFLVLNPEVIDLGET